MGYVYFLYSPQLKKVKIGHSAGVLDRIFTLSGMSPDEKQVLLAIYPGTLSDEDYLKTYFHYINSHKEWFYLDQELISLIVEIRQNWLDRKFGIEYLRLSDVELPEWLTDSGFCSSVIFKELKMSEPKVQLDLLSSSAGVNFNVPNWIPKSIRMSFPKLTPTDKDLAEYKRISESDPRDYSEETITPEIAWLIVMNATNRKVREGKVFGLIQDIEQKNYYVGDSMFMFNHDGIRNGCHRSLACLLSGKPIRVMTRRRVSDEEIPVIDTGVGRTMDDAETMAGNNPSESLYNNKNATVVRVAYSRGKQENTQFSFKTLRKMIDHFQEPLTWLNELLSLYTEEQKRRVGMGIVKAVFLRAYVYGISKEKLEYAYDYLLTDGEKVEKQIISRQPGTTSLRSLRRYLKETMTSAPTSADAVALLYKRVERMLSAYLKEEDLERCHLVNEEQFPISALNFVIPARNSARSIADRMLGTEILASITKWADLNDDGHMFTLRDMFKMICPGEDMRLVKDRMADFIRTKGSLQVGETMIQPVVKPGQVRVVRYTLVKPK